MLIKKSVTKQLHQTVLLRTIDKGIIAISSPLPHSHARNTTNVAPAPQKSPTTVALFQAYRFPPYWSASRNWLVAGAKSAKPIKSSFDRSVRMVDLFIEGLAI